MKSNLAAAVAGVGMFAVTTVAWADGQLNIYNWGDYTSPDLIKKFEQTYNVQVTITDYDSNDTALAKIKAGGHGFDIVVPSANFVPIFIQEGLLAETRPDQMENFKNMDPKWVNVLISGGENIYPSEVESLLGSNPKVQDVAVIGIPDDKWGECVHGVVTLREGGPPADIPCFKTIARR